MGVGIKYDKQVPETFYSLAFVNFEDGIFVRGRGCNTSKGQSWVLFLKT